MIGNGRICQQLLDFRPKDRKIIYQLVIWYWRHKEGTEMAIFDIFSKRLARSKGVVDVYTYDEIPAHLRAQIVHILFDIIGDVRQYASGYDDTQKAYDQMHAILCREYGLFRLADHKRDPMDEFISFILEQPDTEKMFDAVELAFRYIEVIGSRNAWNGVYGRDYRQIVKAAIDELNDRFKEAAVGFQYENGKMIRIDNMLVHQEVVKQALNLLSSPNFAGANEEFLKAHQHYRAGNHKGALNEALKAFESTMKIICKKRRWAFSESDTAKSLIDVCFRNGLIDPFWQSECAALRALLESGVPTGRNKLAGHGQGADKKDVPGYVAAYVIHLTAATIVFLVDAERNLK